MRILLFSLAFCTAFLANATVYYISPSGNDGNNGTSSSTAWKTIDRLNQVTYSIVAGDQILFKRDGTYRGIVSVAAYGTAAAPVTVGAYGTGAAPVISGSMLVSGWSQYNGNIWRANIGAGQNVQYLYMNGQLMTLARYPNTGWLRNDQGTNTSLHDDALTQPSGYWTGSILVVRATNWNYDRATISGFSQGTLSFPTIYDVLGSNNWGYFLCNKLSELDQPGEWYYDQSSGMLYFQAPGNINPSTVTVEASVRDMGLEVSWHRSNVIISGLAFQHQSNACIHVQDADHVTVDGCTFSDAYRGIVSVGHANSYTNSTFTRTYGTALFALDDSSDIMDNEFTDVGMVPGLGESSWGYFGIRTSGTGLVVSGNRLENIGYTGIEVDHNTLVEKNVLINATALLNDGGGIAFDFANGLVIQDNIIRDCTGNLESSASSSVN
ncbi:MAG: right-handed parallel beta-helix repeat-containing protein, partial [Flavobacteriales bacterium]